MMTLFACLFLFFTVFVCGGLSLLPSRQCGVSLKLELRVILGRKQSHKGHECSLLYAAMLLLCLLLKKTDAELSLELILGVGLPMAISNHRRMQEVSNRQPCKI